MSRRSRLDGDDRVPVATIDDAAARAWILAALDRFFERESDLPLDVGERCIAHRLAVYIEDRIRTDGHLWSVDCEYNRMGTDPKRLQSLVGRPRRDGRERDGLAVPDIIVHRRGAAGPNLLAIEVKRVGSYDIDDDREKLRLYKQELGYEHVFLVLIAHLREDCRIEPV